MKGYVFQLLESSAAPSSLVRALHLVSGQHPGRLHTAKRGFIQRRETIYLGSFLSSSFLLGCLTRVW